MSRHNPERETGRIRALHADTQLGGMHEAPSWLSTQVAGLSLWSLCEVQVQQEALAKEYANARYEQPYQTAMYETARPAGAAALAHARIRGGRRGPDCVRPGGGCSIAFLVCTAILRLTETVQAQACLWAKDSMQYVICFAPDTCGPCR